MTLKDARRRLPRFTLLGRAILLIGGCLLSNAVVWIAAGICYGQANGLLGLALLAWVSYPRAAGSNIRHWDFDTRSMQTTSVQSITRHDRWYPSGNFP